MFVAYFSLIVFNLEVKDMQYAILIAIQYNRIITFPSRIADKENGENKMAAPH